VEFRFYRPGAHAVRITGDFARGCHTSLEMEPQADGWWRAATRLPAGEYRFRYLADGQQYADFAAFGVEAHNGGWNSVLVVPRPAGYRRRRPLSDEADEY